MLYYICALHTFWTLAVYAIQRPCGAAAAAGDAEGRPVGCGSRLCARLGGLSKPWRYVLAFGITTVVWHSPALFNVVFLPVKPLMMLDGSTYEVRRPICVCARYAAGVDAA